MNRLLRCVALAAFSLLSFSVNAMPALRQWRTFTQPDGTTIELMLVGDQNLHYYLTRDHVPVVTTDGVSYCYATLRGDLLDSSGIMAHERDARTTQERAATLNKKQLQMATPRSTRYKTRRHVLDAQTHHTHR